MFEIPTPNVIPDENVPFFFPGNYSRKTSKRFMTPYRWMVYYIAIPVCLTLCVLCLGLGIILMSMDEQRFAPVFIALLGVLVVLSCILLYMVGQEKKRSRILDLSCYDFDLTHFPQQEFYTAKNEIWDVRLTQTGLRVEGKHYYYNALSPTLVTSNHFNRVWIAIRFGGDPWHGVYVPLDGGIIRAVEEFEIPLEGKEKLGFLVENKENAFAQIYNRGTFDVF